MNSLSGRFWALWTRPSLQPEGFADEHLELLPAHAVQCVGCLRSSCIVQESFASMASVGRHAGATQAQEWHEVLAPDRQTLPEGCGDRGANLAGLA